MATERTVQEWVDEVGFDALERERARFLRGLVADGLAPSNFLLGNPSALRKARDTRGSSLLEDSRHFIGDLVYNGGMPSQVDTSAFQVGGNLATTEGAVVHRDPILELIQYRPRAPNVEARPILIVPPQINKFYVYDLSAEKSMVRFLLDARLPGVHGVVAQPHGRPPRLGTRGLRRRHRAGTRGDVRDHAASQRPHGRRLRRRHHARCRVGLHGGEGRADCVASLTLMVNVLDTHPRRLGHGTLYDRRGDRGRAQTLGAHRACSTDSDTARVFNWMRPNDLIWNYVVSNYLHGETLPAFDILYWNNDTTRLPARLHGDFLDFFKHNALASPGRLEIHDVPIDLGKVTRPVFIIGGTTDHITPWHACYRSTGLFGGERTFVLSSAGHIQSLINPPGPSKRKFYTNPERRPDADVWRAMRTEHEGSWWPYWAEWLQGARRRRERRADRARRRRSPAACAAPGTYVFE